MRPIVPALLVATGLLCVGACFDPHVTVPDDTEASSSGSESGAPELDTSSSGDGADDSSEESTGPEDLPPQILSFTIDGSTTPAEQHNAGVILLDVDATDDIELDRVELYDGPTLIATLPDSPYQAEILLSSADNGTHEYTARAIDSAGQSADSAQIVKSVNILGGMILELREDIGEVYAPLLDPVPRLTVADDGDVVVTYTSVPNILGRTNLEARRYQSELSLVWDATLNPIGTSVFAMSPPVLTSTGELLVGGRERLTDPASRMMIYRADASTAEPGDPLTLATNDNGLGFPVVGETADGLFLSPSLNVAELRALDLAETIWSQTQFSDEFDDAQAVRGITGIDVDDGFTLVTFAPATPVCAETNYPCVRLLAPDGSTLWTRPVAGIEPLTRPLTARFDPAGNAITAWASNFNGLRVVIYDNGGEQVTEFELFVGEDSLASFDLAVDPQGCLIVVGLLSNDGYHPWAARVTQQGEIVWSTIYDELEHGEFGSLVSDIAISNDGRAYVSGISTLSQDDLFEFSGVGWLAEIDL